MIRRMLQVAVALAMLAAAGCGAGGAGAGQPTVQPQWAVDNAPIFRSAHGMALYALDKGGSPTSPAGAGLRVEETQVSAHQIEWRVIDTTQKAGAVLCRLRSTGSGWYATGLFRGDWGGGKDVLVVPIPTPDASVDIGVAPLRTEPLTAAECVGKCVMHLVFEDSPEKAVLAYPWEDQTGEAGSHDFHLHNGPPFVDWTVGDKEYPGVWAGMDNMAEADAPGYVFNRNKLPLVPTETVNGVGGQINTHVVERIMTDGVETGVRLKFTYQLHGDYNLDNEVNIGDAKTVADQWGRTTDYDCLAATRNDPNPFRSPMPLHDPANFTDGSMDGVVWVAGLTSDEAVNHIFGPMSSGAVTQLHDDVSPILVHYDARVEDIKVRFDRIGDTESPYLEIDLFPQPGGESPYLYSYEFPYYFPETGTGWIESGDYTISITPMWYPGAGPQQGPTTVLNGFLRVPEGHSPY